MADGSVRNRREPDQTADGGAEFLQTSAGYEDESDLMDTSALEGTSENNDDHESYDLDSDSDRPINRSHRRAKHNDIDNGKNNDDKIDHQPQHEASDRSDEFASPSPIGGDVVDSNKTKTCTTTTSVGKATGGVTVVAAATAANISVTNGKVSGTKLISRRERSYRRHRNNNFNELAEYDHDGDIDKSDNDDDDDDEDDDGDGDNQFDDRNTDNNNNNGELIADESLYGKDSARFRGANTASYCNIKRRRQDKQQVFLRARMQSPDRATGADVENTSYGSEEDNDNDNYHDRHQYEANHLGHHQEYSNNNKSRAGHSNADSNYPQQRYNINASQSKISARCSEFGLSSSLPSSIYLRISTIFKRLIKNINDNSASLEAQTTCKQTPVFELQKKCNQAAKYRKGSFDTSKSLSSIEWQRSLSLGSHSDQIMPNSYGSNTRYQQFHDDQQRVAGSSSRRPSNHRRSRETFGPSRRSSASQNGYAKLGYYHHQKQSSKQSILQEYASDVVLNLVGFI